jgi:hypothetical protein
MAPHSGERTSRIRECESVPRRQAYLAKADVADWVSDGDSETLERYVGSFGKPSRLSKRGRSGRRQRERKAQPVERLSRPPEDDARDGEGAVRGSYRLELANCINGHLVERRSFLFNLGHASTPEAVKDRSDIAWDAKVPTRSE